MEPRNRMRMTVVIPTHRRNELLQRTLRSIADARIPQSLREVRVVENGGRHGAESVTEAFRDLANADVRYLYHDQGNKSAALNFAIRDLDDELVVFFDDDVRIHSETLLAYENALATARGPAFFGGPFGCDYEETPPEWLLEYLPVSVRGWVSTDGSGVDASTIFMGCNWAAFAKDIKAAGGFDPNVGPGGLSGGSGQETAMQLALLGAGVSPKYLEDARVWHYVPKSRCSPGWALKRTYRKGITEGLRYEIPANARRLGGVPLWMLRSCFEKGLAIPLTVLSRDPAARHLKRHGFYWELGRIVGIRHQRS